MFTGIGVVGIVVFIRGDLRARARGAPASRAPGVTAAWISGLTDRVFVVTAASSGLGRATAEQLVAEGAKVVLVARASEVLAEVVAALGRRQAVALTADLADPDDRRERPARWPWTPSAAWTERWSVSAAGRPGRRSAPPTASGEPASTSVFLAALRVNRAVVRHGTAADLAIAWVLSTSVKSPIPGLAVSNGLRPGAGDAGQAAGRRARTATAPGWSA